MRAVIAVSIAAFVPACGGFQHGRRSDVHDAVAHVWITTGDKARLLSADPDLPIHRVGEQPDSAGIVVDVSEADTFQEMVGFGAAMTDASAHVIQRMPLDARNALMRELFGAAPGIGLNFVRVPVGASDFSLAHYSYDDVPAGERDTALSHFSIDADLGEKLPLLRQALSINPQLKLVASPWSAPGWMKTSARLIGGTLRGDAVRPFAHYIVKFLDAYAGEGVPVFAVTLQNEPAFEPADYPGMRLDPADRAEIIGRYLGPMLARRSVATRILEWDHNWDRPDQPLAVLADSVARRYVSGVAWHCYAGDVRAQDTVHAAHPDKDAYFTECSGGTWAPNFADNLAWTVRTLIIGSVRSWARGVALWNLALDEHGGPHRGGCGNCRGVITINSKSGEVTRNEEYYALAHASRFVRPGAHRIASGTTAPGIESVAFRNPDGSKVLVVVNSAATRLAFSVHANGIAMRYALPAGAVATICWM